MIKRANELTFDDKKFSMILYGSPGVGKTTLALSAPNPVLIDFDNGISRVKAYHRRLTIVCNNYEEVLKDIRDPAIADCETVIIDTGGSFVSYLQDWAMRDNPAQNRQKNGAISLKGFGAVKQEFQRFTATVRDVMKKNVIYIFHSDEQKDKDGNPQQRLLCEGATRNIVWQPCDFGGYVQMIGDRRVVSFTPTQEYFAKGCYGIEGSFEIPTVGAGDSNNFIAKLFQRAKDAINADAEQFATVNAQYTELMRHIGDIVANVKTAEDATAAAQEIPKLPHVLTSKKEASAMLMERAKSLGFVWSKEEKAFKDGTV